VDGSADRSRVPSQAAWEALEAKTGSTREGKNRSGGHGEGERGKPRRRGGATNAIPTLHSIFTSDCSSLLTLSCVASVADFMLSSDSPSWEFNVNIQSIY
jgi:hypothetical protein